MILKRPVLRAIDALICFIRKLWRPATLCGVAVATWVNLVIIPLVKWQAPDLTAAAAWIASVGALSWVREWGKLKSGSED